MGLHRPVRRAPIRVPGALGQGESLEGLQSNSKEVVSMFVADGEPKLESEFVAGQTIKGASWALFRVRMG